MILLEADTQQQCPSLWVLKTCLMAWGGSRGLGRICDLAGPRLSILGVQPDLAS